MKKLLPLLLLTACAEPAVQTFPKFSTQPKFLVAGQSNAVSPAQEHPPYYSQTGLTAVTDYYGDGTLRVPTAANPVNGSIAWIYAGDALSIPCSFDNIAQGNQSAYRWNTVHFTNRMLPKLQAGSYDAVLWIQGESDLGEHYTEEQTYQNMRELILKAKSVAPSLPWIIALNSNKTVPVENSVRRAQRRIIADGLAFEGPDLDVLRNNPDYVEDSFGEYVGEGLQQVGLLWAAVLKRGL